MSRRKRILKQLYDVKPVKADGSLDWEKIGKPEKIVRLRRKISLEKEIYRKFEDIKAAKEILYSRQFSAKKSKVERRFIREEQKQKLWAKKEKKERANVIQLGKKVPDEFISVSKIYVPKVLFDKRNREEEIFEKNFEYDFSALFDKEPEPEKIQVPLDPDISKSTEEILNFIEKKKTKESKKHRPRRLKLPVLDFFSKSSFSQNRFSNLFAFSVTILLFSLILPSFAFLEKGFETKNLLSQSGENALGELAKAQDNLSAGQFEKASSNFEDSYEILENTNKEILGIGGGFSEILRFLPGVSKVATANYLLKAGENISLAGKSMADSLRPLANIEKPWQSETNSSLAEIFLNLRSGIQETVEKLKAANEDLAKANFSDLPPEIQPKFAALKEKLPIAISSLDSFLKNSDIILDILGYNGPRKFLFLFQNNEEMRATGGFIGSYGILDISNGRIKKLFVDDIYNPDGQLRARVIPPEPIQKMSAVWTMHDANWFPNFPTSAEKVAWFYEKTGGPTVDGIIAMTPEVIEKMLSISGPIDMPEYGVVVDEKNFREIVQYEVEVDYDKEINQPKKIIADLTPKILDRLLSVKNPEKMLAVLNVLNSALKEKHILIYSKNFNIQKMISDQGWSGEMLNTSKDYLSVINSNINGYKTDGVIEEKIEHNVQIKEDGNIVDEVIITRKHNGGNEKYDWWNKVNGDYLRVYVPEGSRLLEASGQTREFVSPPLDYQSLQFKKDLQIEQIEQETKVDEATGTRIYTENNKTVFANWVYVSPGETVVLKYKYQLPFRLSFDELHHPADSFSVLYQKQSGSVGSKLISQINLSHNLKTIWRWPDNVEQSNNSLKMETVLNTDKFVGLAVENK